MKRIISTMLFSASIVFLSIQSMFAGPFGIEKGMTYEQIESISESAPRYVMENVYQITPPKTHEMFEKYYVRIDPDYGVYWLKCVGHEINTDVYGNSLKSELENLVEIIRKSYGKELFRVDELREGSKLVDPEDFMYALYVEDRELYVIWSRIDRDGNFALQPSKLPDELSFIFVHVLAESDTSGFVGLEYNFSNRALVETKGESMF